MTTSRESSIDQGASVSAVSEKLHELRHSSIGLTFSNSGENGMGRGQAQNNTLIVGELRRSFGMGLPFLMIDGKIDGDKNYYLFDTFLVNRLLLCGQKATGTYYARLAAENPEGRHVVVQKLLRETAGCMNFVGWNVDESRISEIAFSKNPPEGTKQDIFAARFLSLLSEQKTSDFTIDEMMALYDSLMEGQNDDSLFPEDPAEAKRRNAILEEVCRTMSADKDSGHPLLLRALIAAHTIAVMKPFHSANAFMARLVFSWAACWTGYPFATYLSLGDFLWRWQNDEITEDDPYLPRASMQEARINHGWYTEWTLCFEEVLGFMEAEIDSLTETLYELLMRRLRLQRLLSQTATYNNRQLDVLLEAILHSDAEFTFSSFMERFDVAYATAYTDLSLLKERGFLIARTDRKTTVFSANDGIKRRVQDFVRQEIPEQYAQIYNEDGSLTEGYLKKERQHILNLRKSILPENANPKPNAPKYNHVRLAFLSEEFTE